MNSENKTWESLKAEYLHQVQKALSLVNHPRSKDVLEDVSCHLDRRFAELGPDQHSWENFQGIITDMGPPAEYAELLDICQNLKRKRPSLKFIVSIAVVFGIVAAAMIGMSIIYQPDRGVVKPGSDINAKVDQLDIDTATLDDVIQIFGEPERYLWGNNTFTKDDLP